MTATAHGAAGPAPIAEPGTTLADLPCLGVGLNHHVEIEAAIVERLDEVDVLEVITENVRVDRRVGAGLRRLMALRPVLLHGVGGSLGAVRPLEPEHLAATLGAVAHWRPAWFSDHLAFSRLGGFDLRQLLPVRRTEANLRRIVDKIRRIRRAAGATPFLVENITAYFDHVDEPIGEAEFLDEVLRQADCGLLLDLNNLHINACNHGTDPQAFLDRLDLSRVVEVHLAGGFTRDGLVIDSHGHRIAEPVWDLLRQVCERGRPRAVIVERDAHFDVDDIFDSIARARRIWRAAVAG